jgi:hypothetical protein
MVLLLGRFLARSIMTTSVPITGPSTVMSEKMPAVWAPPKADMLTALVAMMPQLHPSYSDNMFGRARESVEQQEAEAEGRVWSRVCSEVESSMGLMRSDCKVIRRSEWQQRRAATTATAKGATD